MQHTFFIGNLNVSEAIINVFSCYTLHVYMIFYCSIAISSSFPSESRWIFFLYCCCTLKFHIWTGAEMCNKIYASLYEYFINIEYFCSLLLFQIYYNSISEVVGKESEMYVNFLLSWFWSQHSAPTPCKFHPPSDFICFIQDFICFADPLKLLVKIL